MFRASHGVTEDEWDALSDEERRRRVRHVQPNYNLSDRSCSESFSTDGEDDHHVQQINCSIGMRARDDAKKLGMWPDGAAIGRGHGQPYLQQRWAVKIRDRVKVVEGRPCEGVSTSLAASSFPCRLTCACCTYAVGLSGQAERLCHVQG